MIEKAGNKDVYVRNYTNNFDIKEFISTAMIPKAFPNIPLNKLNLGFTGIVSELISQGIEDAAGTAALMMNEAFITKAILPQSIYADASLYNIGYSFAIPSRCNFALELWIPDILQYAEKVNNTNTVRYVLDKDTCITLGDYAYHLDYNIIIDSFMISGKRVYSVYYDMSEPNAISIVKSKYIRHQIYNNNWLVLFVRMQQFERVRENTNITDNLVTTNSDVILNFQDQMAGIDLKYTTPTGEVQSMEAKVRYTRESINPFVWYQMDTENSIRLMFSSNEGYFVPEFNSQIDSTIYTTAGSSANFDKFNSKSELLVEKNAEVYDYNADTRIVAACLSGSVGGVNRGNIENLRDEVILAHNSVNVLNTDYDLQLWFEKYAKRYGTYSKFFKRRDDPTGRLFSQFVAITDNTYVYPTNTLTIKTDKFDIVNGNEYIIKPGHIWKYIDDSRTDVEMVMNTDLDRPWMITDPTTPTENEYPYMFINPFYIKVLRDPLISTSYNYLINETMWPEDVNIQTNTSFQFQVSTFEISRDFTKNGKDRYKCAILIHPVINESSMVGAYKYCQSIEAPDTYPVRSNNLRTILVFKSAKFGETGYMEFTDVSYDEESDGIKFECSFSIDDDLSSDMLLHVNMDTTTSSSPIHSLITEANGYQGTVVIDAAETSFNFICMINDTDIVAGSPLYGDISLTGYTMANRFANPSRDLTLYKPMTMLRSLLSFNGDELTATLIPMLKYDIALDSNKMPYFVRAFNGQYNAVEPVLDQLDGNTHLDFKMFNTYGRSNNYYVGPDPNNPDLPLYESEEHLDNVYVKIRFAMNVKDRSMYTQTEASVIADIQEFFESLNKGDKTDVHVSDLIHIVVDKEPNVNYIRFLGFNDYDPKVQSIFVKYKDISDLQESDLKPLVPELIRVDADSITIVEEV